MDRQAKAVLKEWKEAMDDGALDLAKQIERANPDLFHAAIEEQLYADHGGEA